MKPLKLICFGLAVVSSVSLIGCKAQEKNSDVPPFFALRETVVAETVTDSAVHNRVSEEYCDTLIASDAYGELIPFIGGYATYRSTEEDSVKQIQNPLYGLCTLDGAVVVDAVYDNIIKHPTDEGGIAYELIKGTDGSIPTSGERWVCASDGSWVFKLPSKRIVKSVGNERVILERTYKSGKNIYKYHEFYTFKGKKKHTFDTALAKDENTTYTIGKFSDDLAPVNITVMVPDKVEEGQKQTYTEQRKAYYIDKDGKTVYEKFQYCGEFYKGLAVVIDENGLYGVLNTKGEWFLEPQFSDIDFNHSRELFACKTTGQYDIYDYEKKLVNFVLCDRGFVDIIDSESFIYKKTNFDTGRTEYFYLESGEPFCCSETGMFPDSDSSVGGLYTCTYSGTGTIFDETGESIAALGDFGGLVDRFGNTAVVVNTTDKKVCFVAVTTKQRTDWLNYHYTREHLDDRYLVLSTTENGVTEYSLYDILTGSFLFENSDYIKVSDIGNAELLSVVAGGKATVYDKALNTVLNIASVGQ